MTTEHGTHIPASGDRRSLVISGWLTGVYFLIELAVGLWSGSVAVTSDAFHTFSAVGGVLIALVAQRLSERPASLEHTFGWGRAEIIGALFNGVFLTVMGIYVFWMGAMRLMETQELPTGVMLWVAAGGLVTELVSMWLLYERQKGNLNLKGAFWHVIQTFVGSLIIIVAALVIRFTGFLQIDPIMGMAFGVVLFVASWRIIRSALRVFLESTPKDLDLEAAITALADIAGVVDVHHVHAWSLTSNRHVLSGHLLVDDFAGAGQRVLGEASRLLKAAFDVYFSTLQVEDECQAIERAAEDIDVTRPQAQLRQHEVEAPDD